MTFKDSGATDETCYGSHCKTYDPRGSFEKCNIESMIPSDPIVKFNSES